MTEYEPTVEQDDRPHNIEAEQATLGAMLLSKDAIADVMEMLRPDDFYRPAHRMIYETITELYGHGEPADTITVYGELFKQGKAGRTGGGLYLHELTEIVPTAVNAAHYAKIVRDCGILRRLVETAVNAREWACNPAGDTAEQVVARVETALANVGGQVASSDYAPMADIMPGTLDEMEAASGRGGEIVGLPTGFTDLDQLTHGLHTDQMIVVAGRPGSGKTTLGVDFARCMAIRNSLPGIVFSLEMSRNDLTQRIISAEARVVLHGIRSGLLSDEDWTRIAKKMSDIATAPLFIDDSPNLTMAQIRRKAHKLKRQHDIRFIVIDYLQLMTSGSRAESRQNEVSEISRTIKVLAKELKIPIVALSQLNRGPEQRQDGRPQISDLRESGSIEQDADLVILLHRPDQKEKEHPRAGEADLIVAKHRNGPTSTLTVAFQGHYSRFVDMAPDRPKEHA